MNLPRFPRCLVVCLTVCVAATLAPTSRARGRPGRRVSPYLLRRIPEAVADPRWCGGLSRSELAAVLHVREWDQVFVLSLLVCYRRGQVDFCGGYVVPAARAGQHRGGARSR